MLAQLGGLGLPLAATYYIARDRTRARAVMRALRPVALVQLATVLCLHVSLLVLVLGRSDRPVLIAGAISVLALPAIFVQQYGLAVLQGEGRFRAFNTLRLLPSILFAAAIIVVAVLGQGNLQTVTAVWVLSSLAAASWTMASARRSWQSDGSGKAPPTREMLSFGTRALLGSSSPLETFRLDQAIVGLFLSPVALGLYVTAVAFTSLPRFVAQSVGMIAYPVIAERESTAARQTMWRFFWATLALTTVIVATIELLAGWLVPFLFGSDFTGAVPIMRILLIGALLLSLRRVLSDGARGAGYPGAGTIAELVSWIALLPALALLAPAYGLTGVAWAFTASAATSIGALVAILVTTQRRNHVDPSEAESAVSAP